MTKRKRAYRTLYLMQRLDEIEFYIRNIRPDDECYRGYLQKAANKLQKSIRRHKDRFRRAGQWVYWIRFINEPMQ